MKKWLVTITIVAAILIVVAILVSMHKTPRWMNRIIPKASNISVPAVVIPATNALEAVLDATVKQNRTKAGGGCRLIKS